MSRHTASARTPSFVRSTTVLSFIVGAALVAAAAAVSGSAFAGTVQFDRYDGHDYAFVASSADFDGAQDTCELMGMDLVTINTLAEQCVLTRVQLAPS